MFEPIRQFFRPRAQRSAPRVPDGTRYYVVGDIHGRLDLLEALAQAIEDDDRRAGMADSQVVLLGDLVDRGPDSAGVIAFARRWSGARKVRILAGNHEEMFLQSLESIEVLRQFIKYGGRETLLSYGIAREDYVRLSLEDLFARLDALVPLDDREFIAAFEEMIVAGDYLFVHAGIDPERPLEDQRRSDMLWIRERFLRHQGPLSHVVVHGHTIYDAVEHCGNRIGIDTGAYASGRLTALVLEGDSQRTISAVGTDGTIAIAFEDIRQ